MARHRAVCRSCEAEEADTSFALNMLRGAALEPEVGFSFDERIMRLHRVRAVKQSFRYWSPAVLGAAIACVAVLAALQMLSRPSSLPTLGVPQPEARRMPVRTSVYPDLERLAPIDASR